jgi:hypothetical protein
MHWSCCKGVTEEMNAELIKIFTKEEIGVAIAQMAALKAPAWMDIRHNFFKKIGIRLEMRYVRRLSKFLIRR